MNSGSGNRPLTIVTVNIYSNMTGLLPAIRHVAQLIIANAFVAANYIVDMTGLKPGFIQTHATHATQALALRALREK